jgi:hypothetical protein
VITDISATAGIYHVSIWGAIYGGYKIQVGKDPVPIECSFNDAGDNEWVSWELMEGHPGAYDPIYDTVFDDFSGEPDGGVASAYIGIYIRWSIYNSVGSPNIGHGGTNDYTPCWQHVGWDDISITVVTEGPAYCGDEGTQYRPADLNNDCYVNLGDVAFLADQWMWCSDPADPTCDVYWRD